MSDDLISRQAAVNALDGLEYTPGEWATSGLTMCKDAIKTLPSAQPAQRIARVFQGIVVEYPSVSAYPEYEGKPYFSIKYTVNGQKFIGYGTYKPEVLSEYLKEYFMPSAQPGWVPVTERLPEKDGKYYVTQLRYGVYDSKMTGAYVRETNHIWYSVRHKRWSVMANCKVVAWIEELPKPWEGKKNE